MKQATNLDQRGVGHVGLIVVVVVIALVGLSGWWVMKNQNKDKDATSLASAELQAAIKNAKCDYDDKDLCKFFTSWKASKHYTIASKQTAKDQQDSAVTIEVDGDNTHTTVVGEASFELISMGDTLYTKNPSDGTWWKQTTKASGGNAASTDYSSEFELDEPTASEDKTTYKKVGKEKCGNFTCFKYQILDPENTNMTQYIWFDDRDYQLRRMQSVSSETTYEATFNYDKVNIKAPSPVKELGENQYIVPGQSEPVTMPNAPSEAEMQQLIEQYQ